MFSFIKNILYLFCPERDRIVKDELGGACSTYGGEVLTGI